MSGLGILAPVFVILGALALFYFGVLFGAWMVESNHRRNRQAPPLMPLADEPEMKR